MITLKYSNKTPQGGILRKHTFILPKIRAIFVAKKNKTYLP